MESNKNTLRCIYPPFELNKRQRGTHPHPLSPRREVKSRREEKTLRRSVDQACGSMGRTAYWPTFFSQFLLVNCRYIYTIYIEFLGKDSLLTWLAEKSPCSIPDAPPFLKTGTLTFCGDFFHPKFENPRCSIDVLFTYMNGSHWACKCSINIQTWSIWE